MCGGEEKGSGLLGERSQDYTRILISPLAKLPRFSWVNVILDRIKVDPKVCEGKPTIRGLRITVDFVLKLLGDGYTADDIVREYPELEKEDVYQAAKYGAWLASEKTSMV